MAPHLKTAEEKLIISISQISKQISSFYARNKEQENINYIFLWSMLWRTLSPYFLFPLCNATIIATSNINEKFLFQMKN